MKKYLLPFVFGTSLVMLAACGGAAENNTATETPQEGVETAAVEAEQLFQQSCSSCHGGNLEGGNGPKLEQVGGKFSKEEIEEIILKGRGAMPGGLLKGEDASAVAAWLAEHK